MGIRDLIDEINGAEGWVTTSSCAGRVSVFMEGAREGGLTATADIENKEKEGEDEMANANADGVEPRTTAKAGGKGGGGRWLFVSHDPVDLRSISTKSLIEKLGMSTVVTPNSIVRNSDRRFVHFKFEPMVNLHFHMRST